MADDMPGRDPNEADADGTSSSTSAVADPRAVLAAWANEHDEWVRFVVRHVLSAGQVLTETELDEAYELFRQEKALAPRVLPVEPRLEVAGGRDEVEEPLTITRVTDVIGVNALVAGAVIEPHEGLTILFGENGTGKTGYARVFKALAGSRTADPILGDIAVESPISPSATIDYLLGSNAHQVSWKGESGKAPFTRMSIFDSPAVNVLVDDDLEYVYVPAALALFQHVIAGLKGVQERADGAIASLTEGTTSIVSRFSRESTIYPLVETLGAATDLPLLKSRLDADPKAGERVALLRKAVAALEANTLGSQLAERKRRARVLLEASTTAACLSEWSVPAYNDLLLKRSTLESDLKTFREGLFAAADLPAAPDESWLSFLTSGEEYRHHLEELGVHDTNRCLYCRQPLSDAGRLLVTKYGEYLEDKIQRDLTVVDRDLETLRRPIQELAMREVDVYVKELAGTSDLPPFFAHLQAVVVSLAEFRTALTKSESIDAETQVTISKLSTEVSASLSATEAESVLLQEQMDNRVEALTKKKTELVELEAAVELSKSWPAIEALVKDAKEADRLKILVRPIPGLSRNITELAKVASDQLINENFEKLFAEECVALRAPNLKLQFVGRQGKAQRRKVLSGRHKPSKVLSEGEQKVLAMADFLAEARLAGISAPVVFDDPVSSLDHRRISEVATRVALLADEVQVVVFTHDILFATTLLSLFERSKRCVYYQVTDEGGKGNVTRATGPRWDSLKNIKGKINESIQAANAESGEARAALVRTGYDWVRAWCEVFTEVELLQGVTQRYQPNVRMTVLPQIKAGALPDAIEVVTRVFDEACRYIDGHSQPLATLGVSPTLSGLEAHWAELQACKKAYDEASS